MKIPLPFAITGIVFASSVVLTAAQPPASSGPGESLFVQNCAFCHGRDAGGGEEGPDLTRSKLVAEDVGGDKIAPVVLNGRQDKGMPRFKLGDQEIRDLAAYIHAQKKLAETQKGGRRGVEPADLQSGNVEEGKQYFNGAGKCSSCHSASGDLAGIASKFEGLRLEERMLYPRGSVASIVVTLPSGEKISGKLAYKDEFHIGMHDTNGWYHSWPTNAIHFTIDNPVEAHAELLGKYTDDDIHNLMAYLQTLR